MPFARGVIAACTKIFKMATAAETRMNLAALQQRDPYIVSIVDTASQVALYKFNAKTNEWEKTDIEGTLFVYSRSATPINGFMILNRLGLKDLIEPLNKNLEFQLQDPFLLYRNAQGAIHGVWFYDKDECARTGQLLNSLVQVAVQTAEEGAARQRRASESDTTMNDRPIASGQPKNVDILQMLCKAQDEYDKAKGGGTKAEPKPMIDNPNASATKQSSLIKPLALKASASGGSSETPVGTEGGSTTPTTHISLDVLFQRASQQHQQQAGVLNADGPDPTGQSHVRVSRSQSMAAERQPGPSSIAASQEAGGSAGQNMPPILRRLISNPGTTVEELERQQRGEMPIRDQMPKPAGAEAPKQQSVQKRLPPAQNDPESPNTTLKRTLNILPQASNLPSKPRDQVDWMPPSGGKDERQNGHSPGLSSDFSQLMSIMSSLGQSSEPSQNALLSSEVLLTPQAFESCSSPNFGAVPAANTLPSPATFSSLGVGDGTRRNESPNLGAVLGAQGGCSDADPISPLSRDQMQQALMYLIRNDADFMKTLHEAYVRSLLSQHR